MMIERETAILEWFIAKKCAENVDSIRPIYVTLRRDRPAGFAYDPFVALPDMPPVRSKRQLLASRHRLLIGAAMIEDLFRE